MNKIKLASNAVGFVVSTLDMKGYPMKKVIAIAALSLLATGCSSISAHEEMVQRQGAMITTNVGGQVFKINRSSDMPNAFGKADVFGRTVNRGYTELRYGGKQDDKLVFHVVEVETYSNETTMNQSAMRTTYTNYNGGYSSSTSYGQDKGYTRSLPANTVTFAVNEERARQFVVSGVIVSVVNSDEISMTYTLQK